MRRSLALLATSGLLPIIALGAVFGIVTLRGQHDAVREQAHTDARFTAVLLATRLDDGLRAMRMIAQSPAFDGPLDPQRFRLLASRLEEVNPAWRTMSVADPSGRRLVDVPEPIGGRPDGPVVDIESLRRAVTGRQPVVGRVLPGPRGAYAFAVRAPVIRDGHVAYVVSAVVPAQVLGRLVLFQPLPPGWRAAIIDGAGNVVASSAPSSTGIGQQMSLPGKMSRQAGRPDFYQFLRHDGTVAIGTWSPVEGTDWSVHVSAPANAYLAPTRNAILLLVGATLLCLLLFLVLARLMVAELRQYRAREVAAVQGQRMEALGRLTGGVAHDFNNLLTPILGGLDLLRTRVAGDARSLRYVEAAITSAERARTLVARLLAFARGQALTPRNVDVAALMTGLADLIDRSVTPAVQVTVRVPGDLPPVHADPAQLELAILNLTINARDAMPNGGAIRIGADVVTDVRVSELPRGDYVRISVTDTGSGMDEATLRQAIDPFFTTKPAEQGTGLGLSMVHGFAAQSGGALQLSSEVGIGTTATILLPKGRGEPAGELRPAVAEPSHAGRILLVDDDEAARTSTAEMLRSAGHAVVEAEGVDRALAILDSGAKVDAVVTDYLMPGRTGADLIRDLRNRDPRMPVLLITGYVSGLSDIPGEVARLAKPFRADELQARLAQLLGALPA
jgi:signal transduction histidine kinase/CheY-like chemotaxis protein